MPAWVARRGGRRWWQAAPLLAAVLVSVWPLGHAGTALVVAEPIDAPDAIIMLASHEWERLPAAAAEARRHPAATLLLTVPREVTQYNCHRCGERLAWLAAEGVPAARVRLLQDLPSTNTYGEARAALADARAHAVRRLLIVTSPYHTRRALATFRRVFDGTSVEVGVIPAAPAEARPESWWSNPYDRAYVAYEWLALLAYRLRGRIASF